MEIDELLARAEIHAVLMRYCRAVDRGDVELLRSVYHNGARDRHGTFDGTGYDFAPYIVSKMDEAEIGGQHHITNITVDLHGAAAKVESYFLAAHPYLGPDAQPRLGLIGGRYLDDFARLDGRWAIAERQVVIDWSRAHLDGTGWPGQTAYPQGARRSADPSPTFFHSLRGV